MKEEETRLRKEMNEEQTRLGKKKKKKLRIEELQDAWRKNGVKALMRSGISADNTSRIKDIISGAAVNPLRQLIMWDIYTLVNFQSWVNDECVNYGLQRIATATCIILSTYFYTKLMEGGCFKYKNVKRWSKKLRWKEKIKQIEHIIVPVNSNSTHWFALVFKVPNHTWFAIDGYDLQTAHCEAAQNIIEFFKKEKIDANWKHAEDPPDGSTGQQHDFNSCGVVVLKLTQRYLKGESLLGCLMPVAQTVRYEILVEWLDESQRLETERNATEK